MISYFFNKKKFILIFPHRKAWGREYVIFGNPASTSSGKAWRTWRPVIEIELFWLVNEIKHFPGVQLNHRFMDTCLTVPYPLTPRVSPSYTFLSKLKLPKINYFFFFKTWVFACLSVVHVFCSILQLESCLLDFILFFIFCQWPSLSTQIVATPPRLQTFLTRFFFFFFG